METSARRSARRNRRDTSGIDLQRIMIVVIYCRVSKDDKGKQKSVTRQRADIEKAIARLYPLWQVTVVLIDNDKPASAGHERLEWERLRELVRKGQCDIVACWEIPRLSRVSEDGQAFMRECRDGGVTGIFKEAGQRGGRVFLLEDADDRSDLRKEFDKAEDESDRLGGRVQDGMEDARASGRPNGIVPFGYIRKYDPENRELLGHEVVGAEAEIIAEIIAYIADGGSVAGMALRLNKRNVPPPTRPDNRGNKHGWAPSTVLGICTNPAYVSKITRVPAFRHTFPGERQFSATMGRNLADLIDCAKRPDNGEPIYPRIVEDDVFYRAAANLTDRPRRSFNPYVTVERGAARHLLTHIAECGACGGNVTPGNRVYQSAVQPGADARPGANAAPGKKGFQRLPEGTQKARKVTRYYRCGRLYDVNVPEAAADEYVGVLVVAKLAELAGARWSTGFSSEELVRTRAELEDRKARLDRETEELLEEKRKPGGGSPALVEVSRATIEVLEREISDLRWKAELQAVPGALRTFAECGDNPDAIAGVWDGLPLEGKRSVLRTLAESVTLLPAKHAGRGQAPVAERIEVIWNPVYITSEDRASAADMGVVISLRCDVTGDRPVSVVGDDPVAQAGLCLVPQRGMVVPALSDPDICRRVGNDVRRTPVEFQLIEMLTQVTVHGC